MQPYVERDLDTPTETAVRASIVDAVALWSAHRPALRAISEHWHAIPELRELRLGVVERFTDVVASEIERERAIGEAPAGSAAGSSQPRSCGRLSVACTLPELASEQEVVGPSIAVWRGPACGGAGVSAIVAGQGRLVNREPCRA